MGGGTSGHLGEGDETSKGSEGTRLPSPLPPVSEFMFSPRTKSRHVIDPRIKYVDSGLVVNTPGRDLNRPPIFGFVRRGRSETPFYSDGSRISLSEGPLGKEGHVRGRTVFSGLLSSKDIPSRVSGDRRVRLGETQGLRC